ncbi:hypothetical protein Pmani_019921 [Petrolisthes manimaculis]|uniref:Uncharacterized protein n=1 Tax=Petrolisthes manimaculis TaxID=1843537 RepID=A0AAE1U732_9EUCA|nr:hypothetical protein Pmani_019921 [Petrolisthes manimaculis]
MQQVMAERERETMGKCGASQKGETGCKRRGPGQCSLNLHGVRTWIGLVLCAIQFSVSLTSALELGSCVALLDGVSSLLVYPSLPDSQRAIYSHLVIIQCL